MADTKQVLEFVRGIEENDGTVEPTYGATAQTITSTTNAPGAANTPARSDHTHSHGSQTNPAHHAIVTQAVNGFMSAADKTKLDKIVHEVLQYTNSAQLVTNNSGTSGVAISLDTDRESSAGTLLTKPTTTTFRTNYNGRVQISYRVWGASSANDRGYEIFIRRAGADLDWSKIRENGKNNINRTGTASDTIEVNCSNGNDFELRIRSIEGANVTVNPNGAKMTVRAIRLN